MLSWVVIVRFQPARIGREPSGTCPDLLEHLAGEFRPGQKHSFPLFHRSRVTTHQSLTPLLATHTNSPSRKPFVCHSYENNRGGYKLFPKWNIPAPVGKELL